MEIYKIIADSKPGRCRDCPMVPVQGLMPCGEQVERQDGEWTHVYNAPDDRCIIEIIDSLDGK